MHPFTQITKVTRRYCKLCGHVSPQTSLFSHADPRNKRQKQWTITMQHMQMLAARVGLYRINKTSLIVAVDNDAACVAPFLAWCSCKYSDYLFLYQIDWAITSLSVNLHIVLTGVHYNIYALWYQITVHSAEGQSNTFRCLTTVWFLWWMCDYSMLSVVDV